MSDNYIFISPSYLSGAARLLDLGATYDSGSYWVSATPAEADARAVAGDWEAVHTDLVAAADTIEQKAQVPEKAA